MDTRSPDVAIVGGGVIGLSIAWRCALAGLDVVVVDSSGGRGATWAAAGMLAPVTEAHFGEEAVLELNVISAQQYPSFVAELEDVSGVDCFYRRSGTLSVARDADDVAALEHLFSFQHRLGLEARRLKGGECRELEPMLAPSVRGGFLAPADHQIDNRALLKALRLACERTGVVIIEDHAERIDLRNGRVAGVGTRSGRDISAGSAVVAGGAWSSNLAGIPSEALPPLRPVKGQLVHLRADTPMLEHNVRGLDVYIVPRVDGRVVVGATVEERGWDQSATVEALYLLLRDAYELVPGLLDCEFIEMSVGLRPATPDNAPVIGDSLVEGLFFATGHFRNGVLLAPVTASALAERLTTGRAPESVAAFSPLRFVAPAEAVR